MLLSISELISFTGSGKADTYEETAASPSFLCKGSIHRHCDSDLLRTQQQGAVARLLRLVFFTQTWDRKTLSFALQVTSRQLTCYRCLLLQLKSFNANDHNQPQKRTNHEQQTKHTAVGID